MSSQVLSEQGSAVETFVRLIRGHAAVTRAMNAQLVADHGLTIINDAAIKGLCWRVERPRTASDEVIGHCRARCAHRMAQRSRFKVRIRLRRAA